MADDVLERVRRCVGEVLARPVEEIGPDSRLMTDLGAESLDLVELMYVMEAEFQIHINREDLNLSAQLGIPDEEIHRGEVLTPQALALLRERHPHAQELLKEGITRRHLASLLTVREVARAVGERVAKGAAASAG